MKLISIEKYIQSIKQNLHLLPKNYYSMRFHRDYIKALSLDEYGKWLEYLKERELDRYKIYRQTHREQIRQREKEYLQDDFNRKRKNEKHLEWKKRNLDRYKKYYENSKQKREKTWLKYYQEHKEEIKARHKEYYKDRQNWLKHKIKHCDWYMKKREDKEFMKKNCERAKKWLQENKERRRQYMKEYYQRREKMNNFNEIKSCVDKTIVDYGGKFLFNEDYKIALVEAKKLFKIWTYEAEPFRFFSGIRTKIKAQLKKQFGLKGYKFEVGKSEKAEKKNIVIDALVYKIWQEVIEEFGKKHTMSVLTLKEASFVEIANNIYRLEGLNELRRNMIKMHIPTLQKMMTRKTGREITILLENEKIEEKQEEKKQDNIKDIFIPKGFKLVKIPRRHKRVNFVFDDDTYNKLKRVSKNNSVSMNELVNQMINAIQEK